MSKKRLKATSGVVFAGLGAAALLRDAGRRARATKIVIKVRDAVMPSRSTAPSDSLGGDVAHAPGHRHLPPPERHDPPEGIEHGSHTVVSHHPGHVHKG